MKLSFPRRCLRLCWFAVAAFSCSLLLSTAAAAKSTPSHRKTFLIHHEVGLAHPASAVITREPMYQLEGNPDDDVKFHVKSHDSTLFGEKSRTRSRSLCWVDTLLALASNVSAQRRLRLDSLFSPNNVESWLLT